MSDPSKTPSLREQFDLALAEVAAAEEALDGLLRDLRVSARAEKTTISRAVQEAFTRLRKARAVFASVREQMPG